MAGLVPAIHELGGAMRGSTLDAITFEA